MWRFRFIMVHRISITYLQHAPLIWRFRIIIHLKHALKCGKCGVLLYILNTPPSCSDFGSSYILNIAPKCDDSASSYILNTPPSFSDFDRRSAGKRPARFAAGGKTLSLPLSLSLSLSRSMNVQSRPYVACCRLANQPAIRDSSS